MRSGKLIFFIGIIIPAIYILPGCVTLYVPNAVNSPMLAEKGQGHVSACLGISGTGLANLQGAYALSDHLGIMASGVYHYRKYTFNQYTSSGAQTLKLVSGEGGVGYFSTFGDQKNKVVQVFGGAGYGTSDARIESTSYPEPQMGADFYGVFLQPGFTFKGKYLDMGIDFRTKFIKLYNINAYLSDQFEWWNTEYTFSTDTTLNFMLFEPTFTMAVGSDHLKGNMQAGFTFPIANADDYFAMYSTPLFFTPLFKLSIGITYCFGRKGEKKP